MTKKQKQELENIMQDIRDFRDNVFCPNAEWQSQGEPDTDKSVECTCIKYDEILDKLEIIKNE
jgi:hypothetical protein